MKQIEEHKMPDINPTLSIIPLSMNEINISNKKWRVSDCLKKQHATVFYKRCIWNSKWQIDRKMIEKGIPC